MAHRTKPQWTPPAGLARTPGWEARLVAVLEAEMQRPFAWGTADCLIQQALICEALTGINPFPMDLRTYASDRSAAALLKRLGFETIEGPLNACFTRCAPASARRGDCGLVALTIEGSNVLAAVTVMGTHAVGRDQTGPVRVPTLSLHSAFRIG